MKRWAVIAAWATGLAVCLAVVAPARLVTDMGAFLPVGATPEQELVTDQLRRGAAGRLLIVAAGDGERGVDPGELERLREALAATGHFRMVMTRPDPDLLAGRDVLFRYRYLLSDRWEPGDFRRPALEAAFARVVEQLRRPDPVVDEAALARDPTGEFRHLLERWIGGRADEGGDGWQLDDGRRVLLAAADAAAYDLSAQAAAIAAVKNAAGDFDPAVPVEIGGAPAIAVASRDAIRTEVLRVTLLASIAAVLVLLVALRALPAVGLALVPVVSGLLAGVAAVRFGFGEVHGITLAFGATLLGVTIDYPLHHLWRSRVDGDMPPARAIRRPLFVGAISTAVGFAALAIAGVSGLQQLAVLAVTGIVAAAVVTSWVLPALAAKPLRRVRRPPALRLRCPRWVPFTLAATLLLGGVLAVATGVRLTTDLAAMSPVPPDVAARDGEFRRALGLADPLYVIALTGDDRETVLQDTEGVAHALRGLVDRGEIDRFEPVSRLLPSAARQRERAQDLPSADELASAVTAATAELPLRSGAFAPFIRDVDASRELPPLKPDDLPAGMLRDWIEERLMVEDGRWLSLVHLGGVTAPAAVADALPGGRLVDLQTETSRLVTGYQRQAVLHFAVGTILIAGVLAAGTASPRRTLQILLIAGGAVGGTVLFLAALGMALSVFHVIALLLVVGLSIDYGVFARPGDRVGAGSVTVCAISSALAFAILATADIPLLRAIGLTVSAGTILAWGLALLFAFSGRATTTDIRS